MDDTRHHFLSESYNTKRMAISQNFLKTLEYTGAHSDNFESHCAALVKYYNTMSKKGTYYNDNIRFKHLYDRITMRNNSEVAVEKEYMLTNHRHNFKGTVTYMKTIMNDIITDGETTGPSRTRIMSQVSVSGNIIGTHVHDVFNISNDLWIT